MREIKRKPDAPLFIPDYVAESVMDIDFKKLFDQGIRYVAFDADSTLVHYRHKKLAPEAKVYLERELKRFKGVCIASNRVTNDLHDIAADIDAQVIRATLLTRKPSRAFFERVITLFNAKPKQIAMVGDKLMADVYGGNKAGLKTVWVKQNGKDSIFDRIFQTRRFEKRITRRHIE